MKKEILLHTEFGKWFVTTQGYPEATTKSYCIYIAAADRSLEIYQEGSNKKSNLLAVLDFEVQNGNSERVEEIIDDANDELSKDKIEKKLNKSLKYIQNWKSALVAYKEFLHDYMEDEIIYEAPAGKTNKNSDKTSKEKAVPGKSTAGLTVGKSYLIGNKKDTDVSYVHPYPDLYKRFHFRIITQDRHYEEIYYPISFIKRLLYLKNERIFLDKWVKELLNKVTVHVEGGQVTLNQVAALKIDNGKVHVEMKNGDVKMTLTKKADNKTLVPLSVGKLKKITLDHDTSLQQIMLGNLAKLATFQEISRELKKYNGPEMNAKLYKKVSGLVLKSNFIERVNIENLKEEMLLISSLTHLQLMDSLENTKKGRS